MSGTDAGGIWFVMPLQPGTYSVALFGSNRYGCSAVQGRGSDGKQLSVMVK